MTYKSTQVVYTGDTPTKIEGNLTLGVTKPVTLTIDRFRREPRNRFREGTLRRRRVGEDQARRLRMKRVCPRHR